MQIPGYEIIKQIGEGGSRTAYLALREHCTDHTVVKVFRTNGVHERIADQKDRHSLQEILQAEVEILRCFADENTYQLPGNSTLYFRALFSRLLFAQRAPSALPRRGGSPCCRGSRSHSGHCNDCSQERANPHESYLH